MPSNKDTIAAIATPSGRSGIGVIRVSGNKSQRIYRSFIGQEPESRRAQYSSFKSSANIVLDKGISIFFKAPMSYTGEDVVEFYAHGNRTILDMLLEEIVTQGARLARPGEFTERAFLNGKIDLVQAEAVADLIDSNSKKAAHSAMQSLEGVFSESILQLKEKIISAKSLIEAFLDFPDEEDIKFDAHPACKNIKECLGLLDSTLIKAKKGRMLDHTPLIVIAGRPNVGKSTLINYFSGNDTAITSEEPGTTRDAIREKILLMDRPVTLIDTAGLHHTDSHLEIKGIEKTHKAIKQADLVLYLIDYNATVKNVNEEIKKYLPTNVKYILVRNKIDLYNKKSAKEEIDDNKCNVSAKTGKGIEELIKKIQQTLDLSIENEDVVFARQRHIDALKAIKKLLEMSLLSIENEEGLEVVAEPLRESLLIFDEIVGKTTTDDILENIFSSFCIGK